MRKDNVITKFKAEDTIIDPIIKNLEDVFQPKYQHLLSSFRLKQDEQAYSVDSAILGALLKSLRKVSDRSKEELKREEEANYRTQLRLCLTWNRFDIAKNFILNDENKDKLGSIDEFMYYSIKNNRHEFVSLFLNNGFVLKNFLTYRRLLKLYNEVIFNLFISFIRIFNSK